MLFSSHMLKNEVLLKARSNRADWYNVTTLVQRLLKGFLNTFKTRVWRLKDNKNDKALQNEFTASGCRLAFSHRNFWGFFVVVFFPPSFLPQRSESRARAPATSASLAQKIRNPHEDSSGARKASACDMTSAINKARAENEKYTQTLRFWYSRAAFFFFMLEKENGEAKSPTAVSRAL